MQDEKAAERNLQLRLEKIRERLGRLTDALIDGQLDKSAFEERKASLLLERKNIEETLSQTKENRRFLPDRLGDLLELARSAYLQYILGNVEDRRDLLLITTSNRQVDAKEPLFTLSEPLCNDIPLGETCQKALLGCFSSLTKVNNQSQKWRS